MKGFDPLIGEWHGEGEIPMEPPMKISAEMPDSTSIIGGGPDTEPQPMHYFRK
jgi:hypothetical protein